ncbi:MAG: zinc ABC transporter substrate-binding protein, partial [Bacilli bacterium]|nr:zinc ABC transporter substrate-binding protein [Bacilli bacterium]
LTQNIKKGFEEYINNPYLKNEIETNYEMLKIDISELDAELKLIADNAENKTIVVSSDLFLFLEKYEFNVISLQEDKITDKKIAEVKDLINKKKIDYIFIKPDEKLNQTINSFVKDYKLETLTYKTAVNLLEEERYEKINFIDIMNYNIDLLKRELYQ